jgi:hypothetical protein
MTRPTNTRFDAIDQIRIDATDRKRLDCACEQVGITPTADARADALAVLRALGVDVEKSYSPGASIHASTPVSQRSDSYIVVAANTAAARAKMIQANRNAWRRDGLEPAVDAATARERMIARNRDAWKR